MYITGAGSYVPGSTPMDTSTGNYADPFTGGGRYVPSSSSGQHVSSQANAVPMQGADPFTGKN